MEIKASGMPGREEKERGKRGGGWVVGWVEKRQINRGNERRGCERGA